MAGVDVSLIPGDQRNFKVTTDEDLERARSLMEAT
jgi:2-C-methyl-D-erythritol 4-phosphate cytidylyltransferase